MRPNDSSPSQAAPASRRRLRPLALFAALIALSACTDGGDASSPTAKTPAPVERAAETTPPPIAKETETVDAGDAAALIGRTVPPYPQGLSEAQGMCVPGGEQPERICDYGLAVLGRETAERTLSNVYLIASANAEPDAKQPLWRVTDALDAPAAQGHELQLGGCRLGGELRNDVVALVRHGNAEYSADIAWAKRLDITSGKFIAVELARVDCVNAGYGI